MDHKEEDSNFRANTLDAWKKEYDEYVVGLEKLKHDHENFTKLTEEIHNLQAKCVSGVKKNRKNMKALKEDLKQFEKTIKDADLQTYKDFFVESELALKHIEFSLPMPIGLIMKLLLGDVNLTLAHVGDRFKYKQEYETFKLKFSFVLAALAVGALATSRRFTETLFYVYMVWFYGSIIVRELILRANGSRIKVWWLFHHYMMMLQAILMAVWPACAAYDTFRTQFIAFVLYVAVVQCLQFNYQAGLLYKKRALGQASNVMDVTAELSTGLTFLMVFLIVAYAFQLFNAYTLLNFLQHYDDDWQILTLGLVFLVVGVGNLYNTSKVAYRKYFPSKLAKKKD